MRIALDVTPATTGGTGVARYASELHAALLRKDIDVRAYAIGRGPYPAPAGARRSRLPLRLAHASWQVTGRPRAEDLVGPVDLVHCLDLLPTPSRAPSVMTAHDLLAVEHPELHSARQVQLQRKQLAAFSRADLVIANSETTGRALVRHGIVESKVTVAPLGCSPVEGEPAPEPGNYVLAVGELAARKNLPMLIEAFRAAQLPEAMELRLVGPEGHGATGATDLLGGRVRAMGRVDDARLARLYAGATALCFPSLAEGFGLPVLEAMAAGTPVIASDLEVLREVAGDAALFVPPTDLRGWVAALERVAADEALRRRMQAAGRAAAAGRTWDATAASTVTAYERLLACE
jgi:glycosyltransferase involved in cell wall biosynthesis